ncbi:MAG: family 20 glycosylhydrolase [Alistipes sp.]|nr:family 20 glycosylhydrolase [Alistipes sp.]
MKRLLFTLAALVAFCFGASAQTSNSPSALDEVLPVRGLAIAAPSKGGMDLFVKFIEEELAPAHFNLLILRVDWNYDYQSHPELSDPNPLTRADVKRLVEVCRRNGIKIAPQINLLGHQSWAETTYALLREYPEFDETPHVDTKNYTQWPNADGLYCKSYCPLHPDMPRVVNALVDEITEVFETDMFHAGMDEVFYIADDKCPRCAGHDPAELFAGEVNRLRNHLALTGKRLMIWGDRLLDGTTTGLGAWEASMNNTARAVDMIAKDVFVCDWHYERADLSAVYFAMKGLDVATCPWRKPELAVKQMNDMIAFRKQTTAATAAHLRGIIETVWSGADSFLREYYGPVAENVEVSVAGTVRRLMTEYKKLKVEN